MTTQKQPFGAFDEVTHDRPGGMAAEQIRLAVRAESENHWIIFDGPADALQIESMSTALDDNKKLCLTRGKIVALILYMRMTFEVDDLAVARPAMVSRCGMVYIEPESLGLGVLCDA